MMFPDREADAGGDQLLLRPAEKITEIRLQFSPLDLAVPATGHLGPSSGLITLLMGTPYPWVAGNRGEFAYFNYFARKVS